MDILNISSLIISLVGTAITIYSAYSAAKSSKNAKLYYNKLRLIEDVEKIDHALAEVKSAKEEYNKLLSILGNARGSTDGSIKSKLKIMSNNLEHVKEELPEKFQEIHELVGKSTVYIDSIISGRKAWGNDRDFKDLKSKLDFILQKLKEYRDILREN